MLKFQKQFFFFLQDPDIKNFLPLLDLLDPQAVKTLYEKNKSLLKSNIKVSVGVPDLSSVRAFLVLSSQKHRKHIKNFDLKVKSHFLWVLSVYEILTLHNSENLDLNDWKFIALLMPDCDPYVLKHKWFNYLKSSKRKCFWGYFQDLQLYNLIKAHYPCFFITKGRLFPSNFRIKWSKISFELNKTVLNALNFKNEKQCRERWQNHLNPSLRKKLWSLEEDRNLLELCLHYPRKWAKIAKAMNGRTQHSVKNRFIRICKCQLKLERKNVNKIEEEHLKELIKKVLALLVQKTSSSSNANLGQFQEEIDHSNEDSLDFLQRFDGNMVCEERQAFYD